MLAELDPDLDLTRRVEVRGHIEELFNTILAEESILLARAERQRLLDQISADILGFGPLEALLEDGSVSAIFVNGAKNVFVMRGGRMTRENVAFEDETHLLRVLARMCAPLGMTPTADTPMIRGTLANGGSFVALLPPLSLTGVSLVVRPPAVRPLIMDDLIDQGVLSGAMASILTAAARAGWNLLIAGDGGVRLLMGLLLGTVPGNERIVGIGADYGLLLGHPNAVALWNSRTPDELMSAAAFVARAWDAS
jgi:pilus assembly protein CpaF